MILEYAPSFRLPHTYLLNGFCRRQAVHSRCYSIPPLPNLHHYPWSTAIRLPSGLTSLFYHNVYELTPSVGTQRASRCNYVQEEGDHSLHRTRFLPSTMYPHERGRIRDRLFDVCRWRLLRCSIRRAGLD